VDVIQKRLKTLKRRLVCGHFLNQSGDVASHMTFPLCFLSTKQERIEKNEELKGQGQALDADQLRSIAQKQDVRDMVKEFEEISKQLEECDAEEVKKAQKAQKKVAAEEGKKIQTVKDQHHEDVHTLLKYISVLNLFGADEVRRNFVGGNVEGLAFTEKDLQTLDILAFELYGQYDPRIG